jgi:hypothetical protein
MPPLVPFAPPVLVPLAPPEAFPEEPPPVAPEDDDPLTPEAPAVELVPDARLLLLHATLLAIPNAKPSAKTRFCQVAERLGKASARTRP